MSLCVRKKAAINNKNIKDVVFRLFFFISISVLQNMQWFSCRFDKISEILEKSVLFHVSSLSYASFAASRTLLQRLLASLNFPLDSEDYSVGINEKWFLRTMAAAQAAENHGDEWGLTWYLRWAIYTSIPTWNHSQNSLAAAEALSLKISSHGTSLKWSRRPSQSARE